MTDSKTTESRTQEFRAEVKQLLHLMIHSLYSNKEIFLRELISNASDAADKLRFEAISDDSLLSEDPVLRITVTADAENRRLTISDNGIGMNAVELENNLGTIARSGTREYLEHAAGGDQDDLSLIGQFGVGFYSSFIVADRVTVDSRRAGDDSAWRWESEGTGEFTIAPSDKTSRGTDIVLHLREGEDEFLDDWRLRQIVRKYSDHISLPIRMPKIAAPDDESAGEPEFETVNSGSALWTRPKADISDEDYQSFYENIAHDPEPPLAWAHNRVEGKLEYTSLLYLPKRAPFDLYDRDQHRGIKLYINRVFVMDEAKHLLPAYLRFVRGIVDSSDLPLNVSREILQGNRVVDRIRAANTKRVLDMIENLAKEKAEAFSEFWKTFGQVIKEGVVEDADNRDRVAGLMRFSSTASEGDDADTGLADYVERMAEGQKEIYYLTADNLKMARSSPHLEGYRARGYEVLLLVDRIDEWVIGHLPEFEGHKLVSVARGEAELEASDEEKGEQARLAKLFEETIDRIAGVLADKIESARVTARLKESPACLVVGEAALSRNLEKLLREAGENVPGSKPVLEVNPGHPLLERMRDTSNDEVFSDLAHLIYEQAVLAEGSALDDPAEFVKRLNRLILSQ